MKLLLGIAAIIGVTTVGWLASEKKKAGQSKLGANKKPRPCIYSALAVEAWAPQSYPNVKFFVATGVNVPPTWEKMMAAGWGPDMLDQVIQGYLVGLITVPKDGLNPRFWLASVPIGPSGPAWNERADMQASYCKSLQDEA